MSIFNVIITAIALSFDCMTICLIYGAQRAAYTKTLANPKDDPFPPIWKEALKCALAFTVAHWVMISLGWFLGDFFIRKIDVFDHWIAFGLLAFVGIKMIVEGFSPKNKTIQVHAMHQWGTLLVLSLATSLDALAVGVSMSMEKVSILPLLIAVGLSVSTISVIGLFLGNLNKRISLKAINLLGGLLLLGIGFRILLQHEYGLF